MTKNREIHFKSYPEGLPVADNFELIENELAGLKDGEVRVKNLYMSVDPYMRGRMTNRKSYIAGFEIDQVLEGGAVGEVIESRDDKLSIGTLVLSFFGWREYAQAPAKYFEQLLKTELSPSYYLGILGMPGLTAYVGLLEVAKPKAGETIFVSGAAGAVGSAVVQIAKLKGLRVVAAVGSDEKKDWLLNEIGIDAVINYKTSENFIKDLAAACPQGIDIYCPS